MDWRETTLTDSDEAEPISYLLDFAVRLTRGERDEVWSGWSFGIQREAVVKVFTNPASAERLLAEARLLAAVEHPAVARVVDSGKLGLDAFVATELLRGETLEDLLARDGPLTPAATLELLLPVLDGLEALHGAGLVHRDVRVGTIFLARDGARVQPKLFGFGLGEPEGRSQEARVTFTAPEVLVGQPPHPRSDLYSLARVAVTCVEPRADGTRRRSAGVGDPVLDMVSLLSPWLVGAPPDRPSARELRKQATKRLAMLTQAPPRRAARRRS